MEFLFEHSTQYLTGEGSKGVRYWVEHKDKLHFSKQPYIIYFIIWTCYWQEEANFIRVLKREYIAIHSQPLICLVIQFYPMVKSL